MLGGGLNSLIPDKNQPSPEGNNFNNSPVNPNPTPPPTTTPEPGLNSPVNPYPEINYPASVQTPAPSAPPIPSAPQPSSFNGAPTPASPIPSQSEQSTPAPAPMTPPATPATADGNPSFIPASSAPSVDSSIDSEITSPPAAAVSPTSDYNDYPFSLRPTEHVFQLEVDKIKPNPFQPRRSFDETALSELAASIAEFGVLQPLVVSKNVIETPTGTDVEYELIAGERRLRASKLAGLSHVPAIIKSPPPRKEKLELAIIENLQREDLNPIESARAFAQLQDTYGLTQREVAARLGKSRESIANTMRLLSLPTYIQDAVAEGKVGESQARLLMTIPDFAAQQTLFEDLIRNNLSVRELRNRITTGKARANAIRRFEETDPEIRHLEERLTELLGTRVKVQQHGDTGKITISFASADELKGIIDRVTPPNEEF